MYDEIMVTHTETRSEAQTGEAYHKQHWLAAQTVFVHAEPRAALRSLSGTIVCRCDLGVVTRVC